MKNVLLLMFAIVSIQRIALGAGEVRCPNGDRVLVAVNRLGGYDAFCLIDDLGLNHPEGHEGSGSWFISEKGRNLRVIRNAVKIGHAKNQALQFRDPLGWFDEKSKQYSFRKEYIACPNGDMAVAAVSVDATKILCVLDSVELAGNSITSAVWQTRSRDYVSGALYTAAGIGIANPSLLELEGFTLWQIEDVATSKNATISEHYLTR